MVLPLRNLYSQRGKIITDRNECEERTKQGDKIQSRRGPTLDWVASDEKTLKLKGSIFEWIKGAIMFNLQNLRASGVLRITRLPLTIVPMDNSQDSAEGVCLPKYIYPALQNFCPFHLRNGPWIFGVPPCEGNRAPRWWETRFAILAVIDFFA